MGVEVVRKTEWLVVLEINCNRERGVMFENCT